MARVGEEFPLECPGCGGDIRLILGGGDRKTLTPGGNVADNDHIHHYGRWNRMYRNGIAIDGVGNRAAHNLIHHAPHIAISFNGNDHVLEFNEIHHVCEESNDAGAMYAGDACRCSGPRLGSLSAGNAHAASGGYALAGRAVEVAVSGTERPRQVGRDRSHGHSFLTLRNNLLGIDPTVVGKKKAEFPATSTARTTSPWATTARRRSGRSAQGRAAFRGTTSG